MTQTSQHSAIVGGSTAGRLLACPGSYTATLALPASANITSVYAAEGSAMHIVMGWLMSERDEAVDGLPPHALLQMWLKEKVQLADNEDPSWGPIALAQSHIDEMILPALERLEELEAGYGGGFRVMGIEERVKFPGVPGAFGTADLILTSDTHILIVDWKFGSGVPVTATYAVDGGEIVNPQLAYYAAAALATRPRLFTRREIVTAIIQPRAESNALSHTTVTRKELRAFVEDVHAAVLLATDRDPPLAKGEHCRWCPAKATCKLWTGKIFELSLIDPRMAPSRPVPAGADAAYGEYLAKAKSLVDMLVMFKAEIDAQMHSFLDAGGAIPGWRLKDKLKSRQWIDAGEVEIELHKLGFGDNEIWQPPKLATFAAADAAAKRKGVKIPAHLRVAPPSNETTIATADDPAPIVDRSTAAADFMTALRRIAQV